MLLLLFLPSLVYPQSKYDYNWTIGYDTSTLDPGGDVILMDFNFSPVKVKTVDRFSSEFATSSMSDENGKLLFYTSGCYVVNASHEIMENGDSINPGIIQQYDCPYGSSNNVGGAMSVPWPDSPDLFLLFINDYAQTDFPGNPGVGSARHLYYNVIDMRLDGGLGAVIAKNQVLIIDSMSTNSIEACRHANGRDWWIITPKTLTNCYFVTLVSPEGIGMPQKICTGLPFDGKTISGQSLFSPDGSKFIRFNKNNGLHIYDFDNETGQLSNEKWINMSALPSYSVGASVSPNSRFLYISSVSVLYQYDLQSPDLEASRVLLAVPDNVPDPFVSSGFTFSALAPDGKIYISSGSSHLSLHVIHRPDCEGLYSLPERRGLALTSWNYYNVPNFPSFRNEPSTSPCDSMLVQTYTPKDGNKDVVLFPNPANEQVNIWINHQLPQDAVWILQDQLGVIVKQVELTLNQEQYVLSLEDLNPGFYAYAVLIEGKKIQRGKLVVVHH